MGIEALSDADLEAYAKGGVGALSDEGLNALSATGPKNRFAPRNAPATAEQLRNRQVALGAGNEAAASIPDMFMNAPANLANLAKMGFGAAATAIGHPDEAPAVTEPPSYTKRLVQALGFSRPEWAPQNSSERLLAAGTAGAVGGAVGGVGGAGVGLASGLVGQGVSEQTGSPALGTLASIATGPAANAAGNYGRGQMAMAEALRSQKQPATETLQELRQAGFVMPPSQVNPLLINHSLEGIAGKAATAQEASIKNQGMVDALIRRGIGAPANMGINEEALGDLAQQRAQPYRDVAALPAIPPRQTGTFIQPGGNTPIMGRTPPTPDALLTEWRDVNLRAKQFWNEYQKQGSVSAYDNYQALQLRAANIQTAMEDAANQAGRPDLIPQLRQARTDIAKIHDVERALNTDRGETSAIDLSNARNRGVPLTGELLTAAKMGNSYPKAVQRPEVIGSPGVNNLMSLLSSGAGGAAGAFMGGMPGAAVGSMAGAVAPSAISMAMRKLLLSRPYQNHMATPNYDAGSISQGLSQIQPTSPLEAALRNYIMSQQLQNQGAP